VELPPLALQPGRQPEAHGILSECRLVLEGGTGARLSVEFARVEPAWLRSVCALLVGAVPAWARPSERTSGAGRDVIQIVPHLKVLVAYEPVDFRKGIDSLAGLCRQQFAQDPSRAPCSSSAIVPPQP
jgi:hypothetical protein